MKRYFYALLIIIFAFPSYSEPLFWSAKKGKLELVIFGSVHVGDERFYPLPNTVTDYLLNSDGLIVETDIQNPGEVQYPPLRIRSQALLNETQQNELVGIAKLLNLNAQELLSLPPWATALQVQMRQFEYLGYSADKGVDIQLLRQAGLNQIPVLSLETFQFQIDLLTKQAEGGKELLISTIEEFDKTEQATHCLIDSWLKGDIKHLEKFAKLAAISPEFEDQFIYQRNKDWAVKLDKGITSQSNKGKYLVVVGTLHLVGRDNLISLLKQRGFETKQLSNSETSLCKFD